MEFISRYDKTFMTYINAKYNKRFRTFDEYSLFLFEKVNKDIDYYYKLEEDIKEYCDYQQERKYGNGKTESKAKEPRQESRTARFN